jgi:hypothetical protein
MLASMLTIDNQTTADRLGSCENNQNATGA